MTTAEERHRDGLSCENPAGFTYDANGRGRWCSDCGAPLGEEASWHPDGDDVPDRWLGFFLATVALLVLLVVAVMVLALSPLNRAQPVAPSAPDRATPSPMWHPSAEWTGVPGFGQLPDSGVRPVVG